MSWGDEFRVLFEEGGQGRLGLGELGNDRGEGGLGEMG